VTLALLFTSTHRAVPLVLSSGELLPDHLRDQLRRAGARDVVTLADLADVAELALRVDEPLLLCTDDLIAHDAVLRHLATSPVGPTVALVLPTLDATDGQAALAEDRGQVVIAGSAAELGDATNGTFGGALRVDPQDLPALAAVVATATREAAPGSPLDWLLTALARADTTISTHRVRLLVARRVAAQSEVAAAEQAVAAVDSDSAELRLSVKEHDDLFTTYAVSTWSSHVTRLAARIGLGPTGVTAISVLLAIGAGVLFGYGGRAALVAGAVLLYLGFVLDCVDGQLARYTRKFSVWGGWLDTMADRAKEYLVYAGLAVGVDRADLGNGWALAIAAMTLQTARHMTDTWYGVLHDEAARRPKLSDATGTTGGLGDRLSRASTRVQSDTGSFSYWLKRTIVFPIGERWALIALTVALFNPLVSLIAVLVWGGLATGYTLVLRSVRARSMGVSVLSGVDTALYRDDGPVARTLGVAGRRLRAPGPLTAGLIAVAGSTALLVAALAGVRGAELRWSVLAAVLVTLFAGLRAAVPHTGSLDWLVPATLRAAEYLFVIAVDVGADVPGPVTFALLFVLALHHYNLTARLEKKEQAPLLRYFGLGWDGRLVLLTAAVIGGVAPVGMTVLALYLFVVFAASSVAGWTKVSAGSRRTAGDSVESGQDKGGSAAGPGPA
jgi:phosphatidylglycerophosphate synthase